MRKFGARVLAAGLLLCGLFAACAAPPSTVSELHYGLTLVPTGLDPHINASSELGIPLRSVYDTLIFRDAQGLFVPGLARAWTISTDGLSYTFSLRAGVSFHDGTPFDGDAVRINLERILNPETKSQKARFMLGPLTRVEVLDALTVRLSLSEPFAPLLDALSQPYCGLASPTALAHWGDTDYQFHQVGTGPYRFAEYVSGDHLTLERNPDYAWGPSIYNNRKAAVERIIFRFYADPATRAPALLSGEADVMGELPPQDALRLKQDPSFQLVPVPIPGQPLALYLNTQSPPTDDLSVRQALIVSAGRQAIIDTIFGGLSPVATSPISSSTWGFVEVVPAAQDTARAEALLDEAGWLREPSSEWRVRNGTALTVEVVIPPWGFNPQVGQMLEQQWEALGIRVNLTQVASFAGLREAQAAGKYNLLSINLSGADPDLMRPFFVSDGSYNLSRVADAQLDTLLGEAARATDPAERLRLMAEAQQRVAALALVLPVRDYVNLNMARAGVEGLSYDAQGWFPLLIDVSLTEP